MNRDSASPTESPYVAVVIDPDRASFATLALEMNQRGYLTFPTEGGAAEEEWIALAAGVDLLVISRDVSAEHICELLAVVEEVSPPSRVVLLGDGQTSYPAGSDIRGATGTRPGGSWCACSTGRDPLASADLRRSRGPFRAAFPRKRAKGIFVLCTRDVRPVCSPSRPVAPPAGPCHS